MEGQPVHNYTGQQFGSYRLLALLGRGGFADVYLAQHTYLRTQVALKLFRARLDDEHMQDFLAQTRVIARLQHPHIVRILECDILFFTDSPTTEIYTLSLHGALLL